MSAPVIWIFFPLAVSAILLFIVRFPRLTKLIAVIMTAILAITAIIQPIGQVLRVGSLAIDITPITYVLGRSLLIENADRFTLSLVYSTLLIFLIALDVRSVPIKFVPLSLAIAGMLVSALAVQPFLYSAVFVEIAVLLMLLIVKEKDKQPANGLLRFLIYLSLAMPSILFAGWILGGAQASTSDETRQLSAVVFLMIGFSIWLAVFPFHSWMPQFSQSITPYVFGFIFSLFPVITLLIIMDYISSLLWLRSAPYLTTALSVVGVIMIVSSGILSSAEKDIKRLLAYTVILETGFSLLILSLRSVSAFQLLYQSFIPRIIAFFLVSYSMNVVRQQGLTLSTPGIRGLIKRLPFATIGILVPLFSIAGFPLFAGFPIRFELFTLLGQMSKGAVIWIAAGLAGFLVTIIRIFTLSTFPDHDKWEINEKISQMAVIGIGLIILIILGLYPQLTVKMITPLIMDIPVLW